jgi:hypothetical protein
MGSQLADHDTGGLFQVNRDIQCADQIDGGGHRLDTSLRCHRQFDRSLRIGNL